MRPITQRERLLMIIAAIAISLLLLYIIVFRIYIGGLKTLEGRIEKKQKELKEIEALWEDYRQIREILPRLESRLARRDFPLLAELETLATKAGIKDRIESIQEFTKPQNEFYKEVAARIKLKDVTLGQLVKYLYEIEHNPTLLRVKALLIERSYASPDLLNVQMDVSTFSHLTLTQSSSGGISRSNFGEKSPTTVTKRASK